MKYIPHLRLTFKCKFWSVVGLLVKTLNFKDIKCQDHCPVGIEIIVLTKSKRICLLTVISSFL